MRELKFRVWNKNTNKYEYTELDYYFVIDQRIKAYEYEQYTGLKDKNGKEIYEGDIIHTECQGLNANYEVVYHKVSFGIWRKNNTYESLAFHNICEVIGNIHENPELLEEEK